MERPSAQGNGRLESDAVNRGGASGGVGDLSDRGSGGGDGHGSVRDKVYIGVFLSSWIISSVVSLFFANYLLRTSGIGEDVFTLWQLACSVIYGLIFTKLLRFQPLSELTRTQVRSVVPLSLAYLVKELLKYASLGRVSVNLFNTIRSSGPFFSIILEVLFLKHFPTNGMIMALIPIIGGVAATSLDEMQASMGRTQLLIYAVGLTAAVASTAINNAQNIYSKILFGQRRIDPISLQIYLSAMSFLMIMPYKATTTLTIGGLTNVSAVLFPSRNLCLQLSLCGFVNFLSSQLAFNTLHLISPVSYSVSNTFKRIVITITAVTVFKERLTPLNGAGIATSIAGVFFYERAVRSYKQARLYEHNHEPRNRV